MWKWSLILRSAFIFLSELLHPTPMDTCSNQTLWKILTGHASRRSSEVVFKEVSSCVQRFKAGLAYYDKKPSLSAENEVKEALKVKGARLKFILHMSKQLDLDQVLCCELFRNFLADSYHGTLDSLNQSLREERETQKLLGQLQDYLLLERRSLLRCVKHLYGFWQDPGHPDREVYERCIELFDREHNYIETVLKQFEKCAKLAPPSLKTKELQEAWQLSRLREQAELLEIVLLYHKDFYHPPQRLLRAVKLFQEHGFVMGVVNTLPSAEVLINHISHLCVLTLVEGMDLEFVQHYQDSPDQYDLSNHLLMKVENKKIFEELDEVFMGWGSLRHHSPVLLAWTMLRFVTQPDGDVESLRCMGKKALDSNVFGYLDNLLDSPFFTGSTPLGLTVQSLVHVLLSMCVTGFREDSLGDVKVLISIATKCFNNPLQRLEFWGKRVEVGAESGVGILLASALKRFPLNLSLVLGLLESLAQDRSCSHSLFQYLDQLDQYACPFSAISPSSLEAGPSELHWRITRSTQFFTRETQHLGLPSFVIGAGTVGVVLSAGEDGLPQVMCWPHCYSAWNLLALVTASLSFTPGIGIEPVQATIVEDVRHIVSLVTMVIKHNWTLYPSLASIIQQFYQLLQKFSPLPHPPTLLLAECLKCLAVVAENDPKEVWLQLGHTGFLPHINSRATIETISIAPGYYNDLMNSWERPRGIYPISMAMLELLLAGFPPGDCPGMLASVVLVMREMFAGSHSWRYRHSANRDQIAHKLLLLCHKILRLKEDEEETSKNPNTAAYCTVGKFVRHFLLCSVGGHSLLSTVALSLETVNYQYAARLSVYSEVLQVEALTLTFEVIDLLLQGKADQNPTPLEQTLATQSLKRRNLSSSVSAPVHLVAIIASYIHHHDNPKVPAGATKLLTRLSQASKMSVYACLGTEAAPVRDAYVHRLRSRLENTDLKVAILELVITCVSSQPGMMELFLNIQTSSTSGQIKYSLGTDSVLRVAMEIITCKGSTVAPELRAVALKLLRSLWLGRHDAALIALRAEKDFWKDITKPLLASKDPNSAMDYLVPSHVMCIVAMEMYYIMRSKVDQDLKDVLVKFSSTGSYRNWVKWLSGASTSESESELLESSLELSRAWSTFLCVAVSQETTFHLTSPELHRVILCDTLSAILVYLDAATAALPLHSDISVSTAMELSVLSMVLMKKWVLDLDAACRSDMVEVLTKILFSLSHLKSSFSVDLLTHSYASLLKLLLSFTTRKEHLHSDRVLNLVPILEDTIKCHSRYSRMKLKHRPDVLSVHVLAAVLHASFTSDYASLCLEVLDRHSVVTMAMAQLEEDLHLTSDLDYVLVVFNMLITMATTKAGAEYLVSNRIHRHINVTLANALSLNKDWGVVWSKGLQLTTNLLQALSHQYLSHALDFVGVYQEKLMLSVDIFHLIQDLHCLEETQRSCQFLCQLSLYQKQWQFAMPLLHSDLVERLVILLGGVVAVMGDSRGSTLKQIVKAMDSRGVLAPEEGPLGALANCRGAREKKHRRASGGKEESSVTWLNDSVIDTDEWVVSSPAYSRLQDGLVSILTSCLATVRHYSVPLSPNIMEGGMDILDYPTLFTLSLAPPSVQPTTSPSLGTLTACLSTGLFLMKKLDPPHSGTPTRTPSKSPMKSPPLQPHTPGQQPQTPGSQPHPQSQSRTEVLTVLEQTVVVLLSQTSRYLADPDIPHQDKLKLRKELASELRNFSKELLRSLKRRTISSPGVLRTTPPSRYHTHSSTSLQDSFSSGRMTSLTFSSTSEQGIFKLALSFSKQFFE